MKFACPNGRALAPFVFAVVALALACQAESPTLGGARTTGKPSGPAGSLGKAATSPSPAPSKSGNGSPSPPAGGSDSKDVNSRVDVGDGHASVETVAPPDQVEATPLGALRTSTAVGKRPVGLAVLENTVKPYFFQGSDLYTLGGADQPEKISVSLEGQGVAIAANGSNALWVLLDQPPNVAHIAVGPGGHSILATFSVPAGPVALAAGDGEAWVAGTGGTLSRVAATGITTFAGFGSPTAIALGPNDVWLTASSGKLFQIRRSDGTKQGEFATGAQPIGVTLDASGSVWTANRGDNTVTRLPAGGSPSNIALGATPRAIIAGPRRVYVGMPREIAFFNYAGTKEGSAPFALLTPDAFALDAYAQVWFTDMTENVVAAAWGKQAQE